MRTATPTTPIIQMHQKQMQQSQPMNQPPNMQQQTSAQQVSQHKRAGAGMLPPHMQLPQFQSAQQQSVIIYIFHFSQCSNLTVGQVTSRLTVYNLFSICELKMLN